MLDSTAVNRIVNCLPKCPSLRSKVLLLRLNTVTFTSLTVLSALRSMVVRNLTSLVVERPLNLYHCTQITDQGLMVALQALPGLQCLDLSNCRNVTDQCLVVALSSLVNLQSLGGLVQLL